MATIRRAVPADLESVNRLLEEVLCVHHEGRPDLFRAQGKKYTDEELLAIFGNDNTPVFVYEDGGEVKGYVFCQLVHQDSGSLQCLDTLYIDDLCIDRSSWGKGIGKALFSWAESWAREKGCHNITLHVWEGNPGAIAFYKAQGMLPQYTSMELLCQ